MNYITVKLTEDQYKSICNLVQKQIVTMESPANDDAKAWWTRLRTTLAKAKS